MTAKKPNPDCKLTGVINISNVDPNLETGVIGFKNRFKITTKAEAARILVREGLASLKKKDRIVISAHE